MNWKSILLGIGSVGRSAYLGWGLTLAMLKYNFDRLLVAGGEQGKWTLFEPEVLRAYLFQIVPASGQTEEFAKLLGWSLPFVWLGVMLTVARLRSAGLKPWLAVLFFLPAVKLVLFAVLCVLPPRIQAESAEDGEPGSDHWLLRLMPQRLVTCAAVAAFITAAGGVGLTAFSTLVLGDYGWSLFVATPFVVGYLATVLCGLQQPDMGPKTAVSVALLANALAGLMLLALAIEGAFCLVMAAPIAAVLGSLGGTVGFATLKALRPRDRGRLCCSVLLAVPLLMMGEHAAAVDAPLLKVVTEVIVAAPPERVWPNVVTFSELPPPREWLFRAGIAYPVRARIDGKGPGAIRHCEFTTGPFVEPIEVWDEPRLLRFSVTSNPAPMQEWTPYREIHPPHLEGFLVSKRGQFLLEGLPEGRTRLQGTTWYQHHLWPAAYWQAWSDWIIHSIHRRVLNHVKSLSEAPEAELRPR